MLGIGEVTYTFATIECDWPHCTNKINLSPGVMDIDREQHELSALRNLATRRGWRIDNTNMRVTCPDHTRENK